MKVLGVRSSGDTLLNSNQKNAPDKPVIFMFRTTKSEFNNNYPKVDYPGSAFIKDTKNIGENETDTKCLLCMQVKD